MREEAAGRGKTDQGYQTHIDRKQSQTPLKQVACDKSLFLSLKKPSNLNQDLAAVSGLTSLPKHREN